MTGAAPDADYIVVGSGAGGGTLAAALVEKGFTVLLIEAGADPDAPAPGMPEDYDVPAFHAQASENPAIAWDFFVEHFADPAEAARDPKRTPAGVYYPRAATLGGCTAHHAMITVPPPPEDWDALAAATGEPGWSGPNMDRHWRAMEACRHRGVWRWLARFGWGDTGHGWSGWLPTQSAMPSEAWRDRALLWTMGASALAAVRAIPNWRGVLRHMFEAKGDPNDARAKSAEGVWYTPLSTRHHKRSSVRERVRAVQAAHPGRLTIAFDTLAARVVIEGGAAAGVECLHGARLYGAHPEPRGTGGAARTFRAGREVILCGGTFNTPQLLLLSGIGPEADLTALGIAPVADLPGVGRNLHDRYEVGVVFRLKRPWHALAGAAFTRTDRIFRLWRDRRAGMYVSNGVALAVTRRSSGAALPDLWLMALLARFEGYAPGYARVIAEDHRALTWAVLKARTSARAGTVTLHSADPRDPPVIQFNSFTGPGADQDLAAVVEGVAIARSIAAPMVAAGRIAEDSPGATVTGNALRQWVRDTAWGHHAAGTARIGPRDSGGVIDAHLRVHGVRNLRVADASAFPDLPGFFLATAVMLLATQAAEFIAGDAAS